MASKETGISRGARLTGEARERVATLAVTLYAGGNSIGEVRDQLRIVYRIDRSWSFVHRVLSESGVKFRRRGGNNRWKGAAKP